MKNLLLLTSFIFCSLIGFTQNELPLANPHGQVSPRKSKLYINDPCIVYLKTEDRNWEEYSLADGQYYVDLTNCGCGKGCICEKHLRIYTNIKGTKVSSEILLEGTKRYEIKYSYSLKKYIITQKSK